MAISKVTLNGVTLMDVTSDTVEANTLLSGVTATKNDGTKVTGSYTPVTPTYQEKTVTPSSQVQIVTAGTEMVENLIGFSGTSEGSDTTLTITKNGETIGQTYTTDGRTNTVIYDKDAGKQYKVWFRIKKWFFGPTTDYEYGTPLEFEVIDTFYSNGNYKDIIIPVNDPDGVITSIRVNRETYYDIRLIFSGGSSIPSGKNYIKYVSNIYSVEEAHYDALSQVTVNAIPSEYVIPTGTLAISQNGTVNVKNYEYANVNVEGGGGTTADETLPVRFLDYDGTVLYSYTAEDFANLTAMPSNPSHTGLTAQGWNWTLADAKEQVAEMGECDIGQMYITDDGKTRIYIELESEDRLMPYLCIAPNGVVEIDWGDGSTEQVDGTSVVSLKNFQHIYSAVGKYVISLRMINNAHVSIYGGGASGILKYTIGNETTAWTYLRAVYKIEIGENCSLGASALKNCYNLQTITIPQDCTIGAYSFYGCSSLRCVIFPNITTTIIGAASIQNYVLQSCSKIVAISLPNGSDAIGMYAFAYCGSLKRLVIPHTVTAINQNAFVYCYDLKSIYLPSGIKTIANSMATGCRNVTDLTIPDSVTVINATAFSNCGAISKIIVPSGVTSIGNQAFGQTYSVKEYHILPTTPPTAGTSIFNNRLADSTIYVPTESLEAYKTATNWSTYASYMVGE